VRSTIQGPRAELIDDEGERQTMANVMIRRGQNGGLAFYLAKKDQEDPILSVEFDQPDKWGGELKLGNGQSFYVEPLSAPPKMPITLRAKRLGGLE
jgi:nitrogen fixation protein NifT